MSNLEANTGKNLFREVTGIDYLRIPIKSKIIEPNDQVNDILDQYTRDQLIDGDILFIAENAKAHIINEVAIVDVNNLGGNVLDNTSVTLSDGFIVKILADNPLGQSNEQTPLGIIRKSEVAREKI